MTDTEFYAAVADILGAEHIGNPFPYYRRTRWNNRAGGRGRYPDHGIVRCFGGVIHIALTSPLINTIVNSKEDALALISESI